MARIKSKDLERRISSLERENIKRKEEIRKNNNQIDVLTEHTILEMLRETNSPYSDKPRYSYEEISSATGRSTGYISNIARQNGLSRRNNFKVIK